MYRPTQIRSPVDFLPVHPPPPPGDHSPMVSVSIGFVGISREHNFPGIILVNLRDKKVVLFEIRCSF